VRRTAPGADCAAFDLVGPAAEVAELLRAIVAHIARDHRDAAVLGDQQRGERLRLGFEQRRQPEHHIAALVAGQVAPGRKRGARGLDSTVDVVSRSAGQFARDCAGAGIDMRVFLAAAGLIAKVADDQGMARQKRRIGLVEGHRQVLSIAALVAGRLESTASATTIPESIEGAADATCRFWQLNAHN
jgi:hypothetical protein